MCVHCGKKVKRRGARFCSRTCVQLDRWGDPLTRLLQRTITAGDCVVWVGKMDRDGYGRMKYKGRSAQSHRVMWEVLRGVIPSGMFVCHHCDNRLCLRVDHLFLGTCSENIADRVNKGRSFSKLSVEQVRSIRNLLKAGESQRQIAREFGVGGTTIHAIAHGYAHKDAFAGGLPERRIPVATSAVGREE